MLKVYTEGLDSYKPWSGAIDTYNLIKSENKLDDLEFLLEDCYPDGINETTLNDILWFDRDWVLEALGIEEEEE